MRRRGITAAVAAFAFFAHGATALALTATNGVYTVAVDSEDFSTYKGRLAAGTASGHPLGASRPILAGLSLPRTSFSTVHSYTTDSDYVQGPPGLSPDSHSLSPTMTFEQLGSTGIRSSTTEVSPDKLTVTTDVKVDGTVPADSIVEVTTRVRNDDNAQVKIGVRYLWDVQVGLDNGPTFQPVGIGAPVQTNEATYPSPAFASWRVEDNGRNFSPPTYDLLGSAAGPVGIGPAPTPPTLVQYGCASPAGNTTFGYTVDTSYDIATSQSLCGDNGDSAVLLLWGDQASNGITIAPGQTASVTAVLAAVPAAAPGFSDTTAPVSQVGPTGCTTTGDVEFTVTDDAVGTGPKWIHTRVDGGLEQATEVAGDPGRANISLPEGTHTIEYWGEDRSANLEPAHHTATVTVDRTKPTVTITSDQGTTRYLRGATASVTTTASDASGLGADPSAKAERIPTDRTGAQSVTRAARDTCGNVQSAAFDYVVLAVSARDFFAVEPTRECTGKRRLKIALRRPGGEKLVSLQVRFNGKTVKRLTGAAVRSPVRLTKVPKGRTTVTLVARTESGVNLSFSRTYAKCPKKKAKRRSRFAH